MELGATSGFLVANLLAVAAAWFMAERAYGRGPSSMRVLAALAGLPIAMILALLVLGNLSALELQWLTGILAVAAGMALLARGRAPHRPGSAEASSVERVLWLLVLATSLGGTAFVLALPHWTGFWYSGDDLTYHGPAIATWLQGGPFHLPTENFHAYYPFNGELIALWFVLPLGSDALAGLTGALWLVITAIALATAALRLGAPAAWIWLPVLLVLASPRVLWPALRIGAVDVAGAGAMLAAIAFLIPTTENRRSDSVYAGLMAGVALGCKVSFAPVAALLAVLPIWMRKTSGADWKHFPVFAGCALLTGAFWYWRNFALTGNPFFPATLGPFEGPFGSDVLGPTRLVTWLLGEPGMTGLWISQIRQYLDWPLPLSLLAATGYAIGIRYARKRPGTLMVATCGLAHVCVFPFLPFSGTDMGTDQLRVAHRFLILPFALGMLLFSVWLSRRIGDRVHFERLFDGLPSWLARPVPVAAAIGLGAIVLVTSAPRLDEANRKLMTRAYPGQAHVGAVWSVIDGLPDGSQIASFGEHAYHTYPLNGRRFQHRISNVDPAGERFEPLHVIWRRVDADRPYLADRVVHNLRFEGVDFVLMTRDGDGRWPSIHSDLAGDPRVGRVYDGNEAILWDIGR